MSLTNEATSSPTSQQEAGSPPTSQQEAGTSRQGSDVKTPPGADPNAPPQQPANPDDDPPCLEGEEVAHPPHAEWPGPNAIYAFCAPGTVGSLCVISPFSDITGLHVGPGTYLIRIRPEQAAHSDPSCLVTVSSSGHVSTMALLPMTLPPAAMDVRMGPGGMPVMLPVAHMPSTLMYIPMVVLAPLMSIVIAGGHPRPRFCTSRSRGCHSLAHPPHSRATARTSHTAKKTRIPNNPITSSGSRNCTLSLPRFQSLLRFWSLPRPTKRRRIQPSLHTTTENFHTRCVKHSSAGVTASAATVRR